MNKKALASGILEMMIFLFVFIVVSFFAITIWTFFNAAVQGLDSDIASNSTKQQISDMSSLLLFLDGVFLFIFLTLWVGLIITSIRLPVENILLFLIFLVVLAAITIVAIILRNAGTELMSQPILWAAQDLYPTMTFFYD